QGFRGESVQTETSWDAESGVVGCVQPLPFETIFRWCGLPDMEMYCKTMLAFSCTLSIASSFGGNINEKVVD
ncbi:hypothetical protein CDAR_5491, partial [Caerostris darwini]